MKRFFLFVCLLWGGMMNSIVAHEQSNTSTYTLSRATFNAATQIQDETKRAHLWYFSTEGKTLSLFNGVGGTSAGNPVYNVERMAFFEDVQFQLTGIPENETITAISFSGNGVDGTTYLKELNGTTVDASADEAKSLDGSGTAQTISQDFGTSGIGRSITFTFSSNKAQISEIVIKTKKLEVATEKNHTWDFSQGFSSEGDNFVFGETQLNGYSYNGTIYDSGRNSMSLGFRAITLAASSDGEDNGSTETELAATKGIQVNGRSQIYSNAIGILGSYSLKIHVERGQQIVLNLRTHTTQHTKVDGNSVTYSLSTDNSSEDDSQTTSNAIVNEWGYAMTGSELTSQATDIKLVALETGDFTLTNVSNVFLYVQKITLSNFTPNVIWSDNDPLVNTAKGEIAFTKDMKNLFPANKDVKFAILECGDGTVNWKSFNTQTGEIKGISGKGGMVIAAYFPISGYFTSAQNTYVLNVTDENISFAEKRPSTNWSKQGYVTYTQKLTGDGLSPFAAPVYEVISKPTNWKAQISQDSGSPDYVLSVSGSGSGTVTVKGTFGNESDTYDLYISGLNFGNNSPSIAYGTTEYEQGVIEAQDASSSSDVTYSLGTAVGVTAQIDATTGKLTNISGSGAIQVIAKSNNSDLEAEYVLTVGCDPSKKKVWDFYSNPLTLTPKGLLGDTPQDIGDATTTTAESAVYDKDNWKYKYKSYKYENGKLTYFKEPLYAYAFPVDGDNALIIQETAGLQFTCDAEKFGIQNRADKIHYRNVKFAGGSTLTIPQLKKNQYVMIYWNPYAGGEGKSGATFTATNVMDLEGREVNKTFVTTGIASDWNNPSDEVGAEPWGATSFQVKEDGDVTFTIADNGWNDIVKIVVDNTYDTPFRIATNNYVAGKGFQGKKICSANHNNMLLAGEGFRVSGYPQETRSMSAATPDFEIRHGADLVEREDIVEYSKRGAPYNLIKLTAKAGMHGNVLVTQTVYGNALNDAGEVDASTRYAFEKNEAWLVVGDVTKQTYPHTWDFTKYNCNWKNERDGNAKATQIERSGCYTSGDWGDDNKTGNGFGVQSVSGYWSGSNHWKDGLYPDVNVSAPNIDKPLFANGSELSYKGNSLKETAGLGIILSDNNLTGGANIVTANSNINFGEDTWGTTCLTLSGDDAIKIPSVNAGMYIFLHCNQAEGSKISVTSSAGDNAIQQGWENNNELINQFNPKGGVWVFKVNQAGDVIVKGLSQIYHIAVTDQVKTFSKVGKATESRDCFIDYSQSGVYTKNSLTAYHAQSSARYDKQNNIINLEKIDVMKPETAGLLLYNDYKATVNGKEVTEHESNFDVPLFAPAVNIEASAFGKNENNKQASSPLKAHVTASYMAPSDANVNRFIFTNVVYDRNDASETKKEKDLGFYIVRKQGNMKANQAYLELPTSLFNTTSAAKQYVRLAFEDINDTLTGIDSVPTDTLPRLESGVYYTLNGVRLASKPQQKGIYILNGKKVVIP